MSDILTDMLNELREQIPDEQDDWQAWLESVSQVIAAHQTKERQLQCIMLVGSDIAKRLNIPWTECMKPIARAVNERLEKP